MTTSLLLLTAVAAAGPVPTFEKDVRPVLEAHCVQCHGDKEPKNGLDLRSRDGLLKGGKTGPAIRPGSLRDSLMWTFIATDKMPADEKKLSDPQKEVIRKWLVAGAPLRETDVSRSAETAGDSVPKRGVEAMAKRIDELIDRKRSAAEVPASPVADDAEFLRRACLDLTGKVPTLERTVAFLDSREPTKRAKLIDELLASPDYGRHFAVIWHSVMISPTLENYRRVNHGQLRDWLADGLNTGRGWGEIVYDLLTPVGEVPPDKITANYKPTGQPLRPQGGYLLAFEVDRRIQPKLIAASSSRVFLGQSIECAQCHNHPLAKWKKEDFWGVAAFFDRVRLMGKGIMDEPNSGKEQVFEQKGADRRYVIPAIQPKPVIDMEDGTEQRTGKFVSARFLDGDPLAEETPGPYRPLFAKWATATDNPFFARATANRYWGHLLGRGFVEPIDDMSDDNPPSHPELLAELAGELAASGFDLKHLIRCVCASTTYQRSGVPLKDNMNDQTFFSRQTPRQLTAEVLYDCLQVVAPEFEKKLKAKDPVLFRNDFLTVLDAGDGSMTEFSRGLQQALRLMNGDGRAFGAEAVRGLIDIDAAPAVNVEKVYLTVLSRRPTEAERERMVKYVTKSGTALDRYGDVFWALLNSGEFIINH